MKSLLQGAIMKTVKYLFGKGEKDEGRNLVTVYDFENDDAANYTFSERIPVRIYPEFSLCLSDLERI